MYCMIYNELLPNKGTCCMTFLDLSSSNFRSRSFSCNSIILNIKCMIRGILYKKSPSTVTGLICLLCLKLHCQGQSHSSSPVDRFDFVAKVHTVAWSKISLWPCIIYSMLVQSRLMTACPAVTPRNWLSQLMLNCSISICDNMYQICIEMQRSTVEMQ